LDRLNTLKLDTDGNTWFDPTGLTDADQQLNVNGIRYATIRNTTWAVNRNDCALLDTYPNQTEVNGFVYTDDDTVFFDDPDGTVSCAMPSGTVFQFGTPVLADPAPPGS